MSWFCHSPKTIKPRKNRIQVKKAPNRKWFGDFLCPKTRNRKENEPIKPKFSVATATKCAVLAAVAAVSFAAGAIAGVHDHKLNQEIIYDSDSGKIISVYNGNADEYDVDLPLYTMEEALCLYQEYKASKYNEIMDALYEEFNSSGTLTAYYDAEGNMHVGLKTE